MILLLLSAYVAGVATCILALCWAARDYRAAFTPTIHQAPLASDAAAGELER